MTTHRFLVLITVAGITLAACGSDAVDTAAPSGAPVTTSHREVRVDDTNGTDATAPTVATATDDALGVYLVDAAGRTLYVFEKDRGTTTACEGGCVANWPPFVEDGTPIAGDGIDATQLGTAAGLAPDQVTYHGHLLYYFVGDQAPGDTNGTGIPDWYAISAAGDNIELS